MTASTAMAGGRGESDANNRAYREGRTRMWAEMLESLAVLAPHYDGHGEPLDRASLRARLEAIASEVLRDATEA